MGYQPPPPVPEPPRDPVVPPAYRRALDLYDRERRRPAVPPDYWPGPLPPRCTSHRAEQLPGRAPGWAICGRCHDPATITWFSPGAAVWPDVPLTPARLALRRRSVAPRRPRFRWWQPWTWRGR